jgi:hypothetical protein
VDNFFSNRQTDELSRDVVAADLTIVPFYPWETRAPAPSDTPTEKLLELINAEKRLFASKFDFVGSVFAADFLPLWMNIKVIRINGTDYNIVIPCSVSTMVSDLGNAIENEVALIIVKRGDESFSYLKSSRWKEKIRGRGLW